jgi:hypothetical protein
MAMSDAELDRLRVALEVLNAQIAEDEDWFQAPPTLSEKQEMDEIDRKYFAERRNPSPCANVAVATLLVSPYLTIAQARAIICLLVLIVMEVSNARFVQ